MMRSRDRILRSHLRQRFVVTMKNETTFEGVIFDADARMIVLAAAQVMTQSGAAPVDGHLFLDRADIAYLQLAQLPPVLEGVIAR